MNRTAYLAEALECLEEAHALEHNAARTLNARTLDDHMKLANQFRVRARELARLAHQPMPTVQVGDMQALLDTKKAQERLIYDA